MITGKPTYLLYIRIYTKITIVYYINYELVYALLYQKVKRLMNFTVYYVTEMNQIR